MNLALGDGAKAVEVSSPLVSNYYHRQTISGGLGFKQGRSGGRVIQQRGCPGNRVRYTPLQRPACDPLSAAGAALVISNVHLSVIVPTRDTSDLTLKCLAAVLRAAAGVRCGYPRG